MPARWYSARIVRLVASLALVAVCAGVVVAYQTTRPRRGPGDPRVFVPAPVFYKHVGGTFTVAIADAYWLETIQYYGEHLKSDRRFDALPAMIDLVTALSPHFRHAYSFGAFALLDASRPDLSYELLKRGFKANPDDWRFPVYLGFFAYTFGAGPDKERVAAAWYARAAQIHGRPEWVPRLAAALYQKGHAREKAIVMWAQVYAQGDKYSRQKAVAALDELLPRNKTARMKAVAGLRELFSADVFVQFIADVFKGYY